jgi:nicotinamidase/pyrazinamidase
MNSALLVVDVQNDFCPPSGSLAVPRGDQVVPVINRLAERFSRVVTTQCWHPPDHCSFQAQGGPWPPHCVAGTGGAELHPGIKLSPVHRVLKGTLSQKDAYSGFDGTDLLDWLRTQGVDTVFVTGLATDYCVRATALDARNAGLMVYAVTDACRGVEVRPGDSERAWRDLLEAGVRLVHSRQAEALAVQT